MVITTHQHMRSSSVVRIVFLFLSVSSVVFSVSFCFSLSSFFSFSFFPIFISPFFSVTLFYFFSVCFSTSFPSAKSVLLMKSPHIIHSFYTCPLTLNLLQYLHQHPQDVPLNWPTSSQTTFILFCTCTRRMCSQHRAGRSLMDANTDLCADSNESLSRGNQCSPMIASLDFFCSSHLSQDKGHHHLSDGCTQELFLWVTQLCIWWEDPLSVHACHPL